MRNSLPVCISALLAVLPALAQAPPDTIIRTTAQEVLLDLVVGIVGAATLIAIALALSLATQLRATEMDTLFRLGAHRATIAKAIGAQILLILGFGAALAATLLIPLAYLSPTLATLMLAAAP